MENKKLSCIDCTVANCNHQQKSYPDFCLTTNMPEEVLEEAMKLYEEDENRRSMIAAGEVEFDFYGQFTRVEEIMAYARKMGLNIIFAHLGYQRPQVIWNEGIAGDIEIERYMNDITVCKKNGIDLVIIHPTFQYEKQDLSEIGISRIKRLIKYAESIDVKVAYENVELNGYLEYIIENINSNNLGICFDCGHCHLFYEGKFDVNKFKNKVFAIHLHDNFKIKDNHNLPFDGTVDWKKTIKQIVDMNYDGYIVIESGYNNYYENLNLEEYYRLAYDKGIKIKMLFDLYKDEN